MLRRSAFLVVLVFTSLGFSVAGASADSCPNEAFRVGASANLPDCRAYEKVSPADKAGSDISFFGTAHSSASGDELQFESTGAFAGSTGAAHADQYVASRSAPGEWSTRGITPFQRPNTFAAFIPTSGYVAFNADLSAGVVLNGNPPEAGQPGASVASYYLGGPGLPYQLITPAPPGEPGPFYQPVFAGASADLTHVFFESSFALTPDTPSGASSELYEWTAGKVRLVGVLPAGNVAPSGASAVFGASPHNFGEGSSNTYQGVSGDGSQVVFSSGSPAQLYLRTAGSATVAISSSQKTGSVGQLAPSGASFMGSASDDGKTISKVFFVSPSELTNDANTGSSSTGSDLYEYDVASGRLSDLTVDTSPGDAEGARVSSGWIAGSTDGSYIYFVAEGVLAPGALGNEPNLYLRHDGSTTYLGPSTRYEGVGQRQVSSDGKRFLYLTSQRLTADDNGGHVEVYLYDAPSATWICTSCASGNPSTADASLSGFLTGYNFSPAYGRRNLSEDGRRVFFETTQALVPADTNGQPDVYEWEEGTVHLVSTGQGAEGAHFMDASANGNDVFFATREQVLSADRDVNVDAYDARVEGGATQPPTPPVCGATGCQGVPSAPPIFATPSSVTDSGVGNFAPPSPPSVKSKAKHRPKHRRHRRAARRNKRPVSRHGRRARSSSQSNQRGR